MAKSEPRFPKTERWIREGLGQGTGKDYVPWIHVRDFSSRGKVSRFKSWKSGRVIQVFSDIELKFAYLLEWSDAVADYYEQFPLLPLEETIVLAERLGVSLPMEDGEPRVRTTDFVIDVEVSGIQTRQARSIKPASELQVKKTVLLLEIERRYWEARTTDWAIATEREIPDAMASNIEWVHDARSLEDHQRLARMPLSDVLPGLRAAIADSDLPLAHTCLDFDRRVGFDPGSSLFLVRHQLANKVWHVDMSKPIDTGEPLELLEVSTAIEKRDVA